jgi:hypothetical protein
MLAARRRAAGAPGFILGPPLWFGFGTPRYQVHASLWLAM